MVASFDDAYVVFDPRCSEVHLIEALSAVIFDACSVVFDLSLFFEVPDDSIQDKSMNYSYRIFLNRKTLVGR